MRSLAWFAAAVATAWLTVRCSDPNPPGVDVGASGGPAGGTTEACSTPAEGCACTTDGATTDCGEVVSKYGDYVSCSMGTRTCASGKWGTCKGDHVSYHSNGMLGASLIGTQGLGAQSSCVNNPCDPYCQMIGDTPAGLDAGSNLTATEAGLSLPPGQAVACQGLQCQISTCDGGASTTLTGTVYDPAGLNPLYHAYVFIPASTPLPALAQGAQPDACGGGGNLPPAVAYQITGADGKFTLTNVPSGANIPLVVQIGKWRRLVTISNVPSCTTTALSSSLTRLPRNQSEGDIPHIGLVANGCDPMECLLTRIGVDTKEFQDPGKGGRIDYYEGYGAALLWGTNPPPGNLLGSSKTLSQYDLVVLPCDCGNEYGGDQSWWAYPSKWGGFGMTSSWDSNLVTYTSGGGRVFSSHYGRQWIEGGGDWGSSWPAPFPGVAKWGWGWGPDPATGIVDQSFQRGVDFASWLKLTGASSTLGQISITPTRFDSFATTALSQQWISYQGGWGVADLTFNTPINVAPASQVGRVMYTDMHLAQGGYSWYFPNECPSGALSAQEKAAEFLLFDLGACLTPLPPAPPAGYTAASFSRQFTASCPAGKFVQWRTFYWEDMTPSDSNIVFSAQTGDTAQTLGSSVPLVTVSGASNLSWVGAGVDLALASANQKSKAVLQVNMALNPSTDKQSAPTLIAWQQTFDCVDAL